ncbi:MAG: hypothetical protein ACRDRL_19655 [Sciscionella sp.]
MTSLRRGGTTTLGTLAVVLVVACATACTSGPSADTARAPAPSAELTAGDALHQAARNLGEAGVLHYRGSLQAEQPLQFDLTATAEGQLRGTIRLGKEKATALGVGDVLYLKAPEGFWDTYLHSTGRNAILAGRWVRLGDTLLGVHLTELFSTKTIGSLLRHDLDDPGDLGARTLHSLRAAGQGDRAELKFADNTVTLDTRAPYGLVRLDHPGQVKGAHALSLEIADTTAEQAAAYTKLAHLAKSVTAPVDISTSVAQRGQHFTGCDAASCSLVTRFSNTTSKAAVVAVSAQWTGDGAALGTCRARSAPVPAGAAGSATCVLGNDQWHSFWSHGHNGDTGTNSHYSANWQAVVLAKGPAADVLAPQLAAAGGPQRPPGPGTGNGTAIYEIDYTDLRAGNNVWKYGVADSANWLGAARVQLEVCATDTGSTCTTRLARSARDPVAGRAELVNLVAQATRTTGSDPAGQWVGTAAR